MRLLPLPGVFSPPSDAWMLAGAIRRERLPPAARALDLCTGSGVLAIAAAQAGAQSVTAVDVSRRAVLAARVNARLNGVRVRALRGDLFAPVGGEQFELIVSNPPYVPSAAQALPRRGLSRAWEAGMDGRSFLDRICAHAGRFLAADGVLLLVHSSACDERATLTALTASGLQASVSVRHRGALGPLMRERRPILRERGLLDGEQEEILVVRAIKPQGSADRGVEGVRGGACATPPAAHAPPGPGRMRPGLPASC